MKNYEMKIEIINKKYIDSLIVSLARQGFDVYLNEELNAVFCTVPENILTEIHYERKG